MYIKVGDYFNTVNSQLIEVTKSCFIKYKKWKHTSNLTSVNYSNLLNKIYMPENVSIKALLSLTIMVQNDISYNVLLVGMWE